MKYASFEIRVIVFESQVDSGHLSALTDYSLKCRSQPETFCRSRLALRRHPDSASHPITGLLDLTRLHSKYLFKTSSDVHKVPQSSVTVKTSASAPPFIKAAKARQLAMTDDAPSPDETPITFNVKSSSDSKYVITVPLSLTVLDLKQKLAGNDFADIPAERQRLIYSGRVLKDPDTLASYKIKEGNTVHLVKGAASNQKQQPSGTSSNPASASQTSTGVPTNLAAGTGRDPLTGLTGARYAGYAQMPNANIFGPDGGVSIKSSIEIKLI